MYGDFSIRLPAMRGRPSRWAVIAQDELAPLDPVFRMRLPDHRWAYQANPGGFSTPLQLNDYAWAYNACWFANDPPIPPVFTPGVLPYGLDHRETYGELVGRVEGRDSWEYFDDEGNDNDGRLKAFDSAHSVHGGFKPTYQYVNARGYRHTAWLFDLNLLYDYYPDISGLVPHSAYVEWTHIRSGVSVTGLAFDPDGFADWAQEDFGLGLCSETKFRLNQINLSFPVETDTVADGPAWAIGNPFRVPAPKDLTQFAAIDSPTPNLGTVIRNLKTFDMGETEVTEPHYESGGTVYVSRAYNSSYDGVSTGQAELDFSPTSKFDNLMAVSLDLSWNAGGERIPMPVPMSTDDYTEYDIKSEALMDLYVDLVVRFVEP